MGNPKRLMEGKMVGLVETPIPNPYDGSPDESRIVLHFTDGTSVEIKGGGDDCDDWVEIEALSHSEQLERAHKAVDYEREQEEGRIKRREWIALSCEERKAKLAERKPGDLIMEDAMLSMLNDSFEPRATFYDQPERTVHDPCPKCRERECPNAPTRVIPAKRGIFGSHIKAFLGDADATQ